MSRIHSQPLDHHASDSSLPHRHAQGQLLCIDAGMVTVLAEHSRWTLPPGCLGWVPPHALHGATFHGPTRGVNFYVEEAWASAHFPLSWKVVVNTPLLNALLKEMHRDAKRCRHEAYQAVLADLLGREPDQPLNIPMPRDQRLRQLTEHLLGHPDDDADLDAWAQRLHMSRRTLTRRFQAETGTSWVQWRQHARLMLALERLTAGQSVTAVALEMGYGSLSAFITLFKQRMGLPPKAWLERTMPER